MKGAKELHNRIIGLLNSGKPEEAKSVIQLELEQFQKGTTKSLFFILEIACSHISIGQDLRDGGFAKLGLDILLKYRSQFQEILTPQSLNYSIGNGYQAIYDSTFGDGKDEFPNAEEVKGDLAMAKEHFWKAYKEIDLHNLDESSIMVLTNLGNNLIMAGRMVEALQLFDSVLQFDSEFVNAQASKAETLMRHLRVSKSSHTISLFAEMYRLYTSAAQRSVWTEEKTERLKAAADYCKHFLVENEVDLDGLESEFKQNKIEFDNHSHEVQFYLLNFFNLSEHGLYCFCNGSTPDRLTIGKPEQVTYDKLVIAMEFTLNQLKSEFSLARRLFYEYKEGDMDSMHFEEISENYVSGIAAEKLRTSFRLCFGVLDKIANGICALYDIDRGKDNIYFASFWKKKADSCPRWKRINEIRNIHLTALYSMACDLDTKVGELKQYKEWRNALEHETFSLTRGQETDQKMDFLLKSFSTEQEFESKSKHLIQLTRAAIFSFVYCVRTERLN